ncbi:hypothetical protein J7E70_03870 [Variovorax paradoxus]|nr:hypothetical protein [Variovorax paradoxus]MBT2299595.1 hypothetical protein [Variovorax paradoxus]
MRADALPSATKVNTARRNGVVWTAFIDEYELALRSVECDYPVLDPDSTEFEENVMLEVYEAMKGFVKQGTPPALAVRLAAVQRFDN